MTTNVVSGFESCGAEANGAGDQANELLGRHCWHGVDWILEFSGSQSKRVLDREHVWYINGRVLSARSC
jgi:hypothetical protein